MRGLAAAVAAFLLVVVAGGATLAGEAALAAGPAAGPVEPAYPPATGYVVDAAGLLAPATREHLEAVCRELDEKTGAQIAVALVPSIAPLDIDAYAVELFRRWGVGRNKQDNGVLLAVARDERRVRFEVGYGLEGLLPDGRMGGILREAVLPYLRRNDWNAGLTGGVESVAAIVAADRGVTLATLGAGSGERPTRARARRGRLPLAAILGIVVFILMVSSRRTMVGSSSRRRAYWGGYGGFGGFGGGGGGFGGFGGGGSGGGGASSGF